MYYLKAFLNSFYNFSWLRTQVNSGKKSANYIVLFILALSLVAASFMSYMIPKKLIDLRDGLMNNVPNFSATMTDNHLAVNNLVQPYTFESDDLLVRVDTAVSSTDFSFDKFVNGLKKDVLYFTSTSMYSYDSASGYTNYTIYQSIPNKTFDKQFILNYSNSILHNTKLFFGIFLLMSFIGFSVFKLLNLLLISLVVYLINKNSQSDKLTFGQIYTMGLFALTGPSVLVAVLQLFNYSISFLYSILLVVILVIVSSKKYSNLKLEEKTEITSIK
ncbi:MAG: DUF1189 family protein [Candidatus Magasanikbacteria bacterium]